jgi:hypothetical protein
LGKWRDKEESDKIKSRFDKRFEAVFGVKIKPLI